MKVTREVIETVVSELVRTAKYTGKTETATIAGASVEYDVTGRLFYITAANGLERMTDSGNSAVNHIWANQTPAPASETATSDAYRVARPHSVIATIDGKPARMTYAPGTGYRTIGPGFDTDAAHRRTWEYVTGV